MTLLNGAGKFIDLGFYKYVSPTGFPFCILHSAFATRSGPFIKGFLDDRFADFSPGPGFVVTDPANAPARAEFRLGLFPPDHHVPANAPMPTQPTKQKNNWDESETHIQLPT
jgi:hypothetical protein